MRSRRGGAARGLGAGLVAALAVATSAPLPAARALIDVASETAGPRPVVVTLLANAGAHLAGARGSVLVDALFGDGIDGYSAVPHAVRARLEEGRGEFADVVLILATHAHRDHFDAATVARHMRANPRARFASTAEAVRQVADAGDAEIAGRLRTLAPTATASDSYDIAGVRVTAYALHHGRELARPVENLGLRIELDGSRVVHLGDAEANADEIAAAGLAPLADGLALVPFWRLLERADRDALGRALGAARLIALHVPAPQAPRDWFGPDGDAAAIRSRLAAEGGAAVELVDRPGARLDVPRSGAERGR